jgi:hypothetical protein
MEALSSSGYSVNFYRITCRYIPEVSTFYSHRSENVESSEAFIVQYWLLDYLRGSEIHFLYWVPSVAPKKLRSVRSVERLHLYGKNSRIYRLKI